MRLVALGFLAGVLGLQQLTMLPNPLWRYALPVALIVFIFLPRLRFFTAIVLGFLYAFGPALDYAAHQLPVDLEGQDMILTGIVRSIPETHDDRTRFELDLQALDRISNASDSQVMPRFQGLPERISLSWFHAPSDLMPGQQWRLPVRLRRPRGYMNPGGFEYEAWLYHRGIQATGYVHVPRGQSRTGDETLTPLRVADQVTGYALPRLRWRIAQALNRVLNGHAALGIVQALAIGHRAAIDKEQWQVLRQTGTNHLVAISGLHVGLVAGLMFFFIRWCWSRSARLLRWFNAPQVAAVASLFSAFSYAALAGFSVPTQRALIMVAVVMVAILLRRAIRPSQGMALALLGVLLLDPLAVLDVGFWLSFSAVAVILWAMTGRLAITGWWWRWGRVQWVALIGLLPFLVVFFNQVPLLSPIANFLAIPWVSFVSVPLCLAAVPSLLVWPALGQWLAGFAASSIELLLQWLEFVSRMDWVLWPVPDPGIFVIGLAVFTSVLLLLPSSIAIRWLALPLALPLALAGSEALNEGQFEVNILDVGQGSAVVLRTSGHVLLYDAGPRFSESFDTGEAVVLPYLRSRGLRHIDRLVVSHGDNDHVGGVSSVMQGMVVDSLISSERRGLQGAGFEPCQRGQSWQWDGVTFTILNPGDDVYSASSKVNNRSCVLHVQSRGASVLLTGDIEKGAEADIVQQVNTVPGRIHADVLLVPHHGSATSSSASFINAVSPRIAVMSLGYKNRYGFPKPKVLERYLQSGVKVLDTASYGAIQLILGGERGILQRPSYRLLKQRYWSAITAHPRG